MLLLLLKLFVHRKNIERIYTKIGTSLVVQWLRLCASNAGGTGLIPGWGTKIPHAAGCAPPKKSILRKKNKT